ncbi:DUF4397 domain-containing protein [Pedobacter alluvionis]|uniref:DUF4397 domain-containing protein n=1 Tax=Pedobacter alluvionis TaxID=475253 RepID=A0A497YBV9_9SPHI|nr:DUF4397 domain-containing protein [Pedobacter alluvionis]RLJ79967.1 uncharacterized protein DUF4397 [Pedobacter alluvionis]TFB31269.1 DUF4397 domain-containing protein [Pedobacter alluvionis]
MKNTVLFSKIFLLFACAFLISSCIKNDNFIKGDAKIRFFQAASTDTTQNFYLNGIQIGTSVAYNTNTSYVVIAGDSVFNITSKNIGTGVDVTSLANQEFKIGQNYSVFYYKEKTDGPAKLKVYTDDVKPDLDSAKLTFLNLGYTLGSKVVITDSTNTANPIESLLGYGETKTFKVKVNNIMKYAFKLSSPTATNPPPVVTRLDSLTINNGRVYLILFDGDKKGELKNRIISSN